MFRGLAIFSVAMWIISERPAFSEQAVNPETARNESTVEVKMEKVGQGYLFDYGDLVISVRYLSDRRLTWEQIKGPEVGLKAEEEYRFAVIRPGLYFIWWQENDTSVVTQVVDFEKGRVHTTWISAEKTVSSFQGTVTTKGP